MLQHHVRSENCTGCCADLKGLLIEIGKNFVKLQHNAEKYVVLTILLFAFLFLLSISRKRFPKVQLNKIVSSSCYILIPVLLTYTLGLTGQMGNITLGSIWSVLVLYVYGSLDNLTAISLDERNGRLKLFSQFLSNFVLAIFMILIISPSKIMVASHLVVFVVLCVKVVERIVALAYAAGATPRIRKTMRKMIKYMNKDEEGEVDPVSMHGYNYLVGPRYSKAKEGFIVEGITIEDVWGCNGRLLSSESGGAQLKDTCLSFALFWLLLGKFWGCRLYNGDSRRKAWKLVHDGLLSGKLGENERVFRVIEVELNFLQDYFYSKYMVFYLHGFYLKLCFLAFPIMFWWFTFKLVDYKADNILIVFYYALDLHESPIPTGIVSLVILFLEVIQLGVLISSRWFQVTLLSYYVKKEKSKNNNGLLGRCFEIFVRIISRISQWSNTVLFKPWKRELDQYSLLESCTSFGVQNSFLQEVSAVFGFLGLPKVGRKQGKSVALSEDVKSAVVLSLQTNGPELSNGGVFSLRRNEVEEGLSWGCKLDCDSEVILVWHIATSICEMRRNSQQNSIQSTEDDFKVATSLSKYCAYLLVFSPSLLHVPLVEAEDVCDIAIKEARELFKKHVSPCGHVEEVNKYEKLKELISDEEAGARRNTTIQRGAQLGEDLLSIVKDEGRRWKILAEFWAEMILFLASLNNNEVAHVEKLGDGGEFITHLWALLVHAGMVDRDN